MSKLNENIKKQRLNQGMTLREVGNAVGVTHATIQRYESGDIANIDSEMVIKLAKCLHTTPSALMGWEPPVLTGNKKLDELFTLCVQMNDKQLQTVLDVVYAIVKNV